jgi:histidinol phosphatase-like PHP family hydrolase
MRYFDASLPYFRGNLHLHTTDSDGRLSPEQAVSLYAAAGYDFVALTDHWRRYQGPQRCGYMAVLPGIELDVFPDAAQTVHLVGFGVGEQIDALASRDLNAQELIDAIRASGGYAILAHPAWSLNTNTLICGLQNLTAAEVFNSLSRTPWNGDRADSANLLDAASAHGVRLPFVASDDSHFYTGEQCGAFTVAQCDTPTAPAIAQALAQGRSYASQGPKFTHIELDQDELIIECSPVSKITVYSNLFYVADRCQSGTGLTGRRYRIRRTPTAETFVRCQITDAQGRHAWTSPLSV